MIHLMPPTGMGIGLFEQKANFLLAQATADTTNSSPIDKVANTLGVSTGDFLPGIVNAFIIGIIGIVAAFLLAAVAKGLLKKTSIDDTIAAKITNRPADELHVANWVSTAVFWVVILFTVVGVLDALQLDSISAPLTNLLDTIFGFLPQLLAAGLWLVAAWVVATIVKMLVTRGLEAFNLDDRLAENTGVDPRENSVRIHETIGNALYWFVFLLFLPLILDTLALDGLLEPVEALISQFLSAIPKIILAAIIFAVGWLAAKIVRGIVTNLLSATGIDNFGRQLGLSGNAGTPGISLSSLAGTIVYVLVLIPAAIAALNALDIDAISAPAISMLDQISDFIPLLIGAIAALVVFFFVGKFLSEIVSSLLSSAGFDSVLETLGFPEISAPTREPSTPPVSAYDNPSISADPGATTLQPTTTTSTSSNKTPSEIVGLIVQVGVVLFGTVIATEALQLDQLTLIVRAIMEIAAQVLVGVVIFGVGVYLANLAFRLIKSSSSGSSNMLAQAARISILAFVGAMALGQMGVAPNIVNLAFGLLLGAIAIAIAISFGLGGREAAGKQVEEWLSDLKK
ncbi:MAG: mechanosensitive ion channel [Cyanobacteria bacterium J06581_3]